MIDPLGSTILGMRAALVALDVALKATALMTMIFAGHLALGRRRAPARSALWNAGLVGLLLLPAAGVAFPRLRLTVPSRWAAVRFEAPAPVPDNPRDVMPLPGQTSTVEAEPITVGVRIPTAADAMPRPDRNRAVSVPAALSRPRPWVGGIDLALGVYLAVAARLGMRLIVSMAMVGRLRRRCAAVVESRWVEALDRWRTRLGVSRNVAMLATDSVSIPIVVGWLRPAIILPRALTGTARPCAIDAVLLHELGHVRRGDFGWNVIRKLVEIVYWPHPFMWLVGRVVGAVREQACDDLCVHGLGGPDAYRDTLLEVASGLVRRPGPALGLAMARSTNLGRRLAWIDRTKGTSRCLLRWPARLGLAIAVAAAAGLLGAVELSRAAVKAPEQPEQSVEASVAPRTIDIVVRAQDTGKPIEGASVRYFIDMEHHLRKTDRDGRVRILLFRHRSRDRLGMDVWAEGYVQQRHTFSQNDARHSKIPDQFTVELLPGEQTLGGTVTDEQGRPIHGVKVEIWGYLGEKKRKEELAYHVDATTDDQGRWRCRCFRNMTFAYLYLSHPDYLSDTRPHPRPHGRPILSEKDLPDNRPLQALRDFSDAQVMTRGVEVAGEVLDEKGKPVEGAEVGWIEAGQNQVTFHDVVVKTTTDERGRFRFSHARPGQLSLQVKARGHAPELQPIDARPGAGPVAITLEPAHALEGRVVDTSGNPIPEAFVVIDTWRTFRSLGVFLWTDADGRFRWENAPADEIQLDATHTGFEYATQRRATAGDEIVITLRRVVSISGRISDAATGKRVDNTEVEVGVPASKTGEVRWEDRPNVFASQGHLQADVDIEETPEFRLRIRARGYEPFVSRPFRRGEPQSELDVALKKTDKPLEVPVPGTVLRPDGKPLAGAEVAIAYPREGGRLRLPMVPVANGRLLSNVVLTPTTARAKTDDQGGFRLTREPDPEGRYFGIVVVHPDYCAEVGRAAFEADSIIRAKPWGRIEGVARIGNQPAAGETIRYFADRRTDFDVPHITDAGDTKADAEGRFAFERVLPGEVRVARGFAAGANVRGWSNGVLLDVKPGETTRAEVGGRGRPVIARVAFPPGFEPEADHATAASLEIQSAGGAIPHLEAPPGQGGSDFDMVRKWWASTEGREYRRHFFYRSVWTELRPDGTIRVDDVPQGEYRVTLTLRATPTRGPSTRARNASVTQRNTIPEVSGGRSDEPFDLGVLEPKPR